MKKSAQILLGIFCLCLPATLHAQDKNDSEYLAGAVPEIDGKVVFTKEFSIPGMSQEKIYERVYSWMENRLKKNENNSRIVFSDQAKGQIVGVGDEWIVFKSTALSLDRTKILYQLMATCQPEKCILEIGKIHYNYREGEEKYTAEEWITDKYALNKSQTKLIRGLAKWRTKTVDFADELGMGIAEALSATEKSQMQKEEKSTEKGTTKTGPIVIVPKQQVTMENSKVQQAVTSAVSMTSPKVATAPTSGKPFNYKEIMPDQLSADAIQSGNGKLVIVIGQEPFNLTMMTANSGGSLGKVNGKKVVFTILSADQPYEQLEKTENYTVRFYPTGATEPTVILECKKLPSPAAMDGMPRTYVGEILKAKTKQ